MLADIIPVVGTNPALSLFTYLVPESLTENVVPGLLVRIPFRNKTLLGIVYKINTQTTTPLTKIKTIAEILSVIPILPPHLLALSVELSALNRSSLGSFIKNLLPAHGPRNLKKIISSLQPFKQQTKIATTPIFKCVANLAELKKILSQVGSQNGQELILVPEHQLIPILKNLLPKKLKLLTISSLSGAPAFYKAWDASRNTNKSIILGTRRALFLPFCNLKKIWLLEEGDSSYKSFDSAPRYLTSEIAARIAKLTGAELVCISHTPSVANYPRYQNTVSSLRPYELVDMQSERLGGNASVLSSAVEEAIKGATGNVLILLNRRGSTTAISCRDCQHVFRCPNCSRALILFDKTSELRCLYCNISEPFTGTCPKCRGANLKLTGVGTELLERALRLKPFTKRFKLERIDSETKFTPTTIQLPYLIVGTDQVFKYLPAEKFSLVAILDADTPLFIPEYSATEELWQRIRTIRFWLPEPAQLFIQTRQPNHNLFQGLWNPKTFYESELSARKLFNFPPYSTILKAFRSGPDAIILEEAKHINKRLSGLTKTLKIATIEPNRPAYPPRIRGELRLVIIIKFLITATAEDKLTVLKALPPKWKIDFNPLSLLSI